MRLQALYIRDSLLLGICLAILVTFTWIQPAAQSHQYNAYYPQKTIKPVSGPQALPPNEARTLQRNPEPAKPTPPRAVETLGFRAYSPEEVRGLIEHHASVLGLDVALVLRIAECESGLRYDAANSTSSAKGVMQFLAGTWANTSEGRKGTSVFDADANIRMALTNIAVHGTTAWNSSISCWG